MNPLPWPNTFEKKMKMANYRLYNLRYAKKNPYENAVWNHLQRTHYEWERQKIWGFRIFDFWCELLGIAVEVDGNTHDPVKDAQMDKAYLECEEIIILRIRNGNGKDLDLALEAIKKANPWKFRRDNRGLPPLHRILFPKSEYESKSKLLPSRLGCAAYVLRQNGISRPTQEEIAIAQKMGVKKFIRAYHPDLWKQRRLARKEQRKVAKKRLKFRHMNKKRKSK